MASSNCLFSVISSLAPGLSVATSDVFVSQQEGKLVSYFQSHDLKVRSLFPLSPGSHSSLRAAAPTAVGAGRGTSGSIVKVKKSENTRGQKKASAQLKHLFGSGEPQDGRTKTLQPLWL